MTFRNASVLYGFMSVLLFLHGFEYATADPQKTKLRSRNLDIPSDISSFTQQEDYLTDHLQEQKHKDRELFTRIVGGKPAAVGAYPWYAIPNGNGMCGASLIGPDILITAAHCFFAFNKKRRNRKINVVLGINKLTELQNQALDKYPIKSLHVHPQYNKQTLENDVMLIKLKVPVGNHVPFIPYNVDPLVPANGESATIIGFGLDSENGSIMIDLQEGKLNIVDRDTCEHAYGDWLVDSVMICAGVSSGAVDSCQGDSGGPLIREDGTLIGIVSFGIGCGRENIPGIYTRVSAVSKFIDWGLCDLTSYPILRCTDAVGFATEARGYDNMSLPFATPSSTSPVHAITQPQSEYQVHDMNHSMTTEPTCETMCTLMSISGYVVHKIEGSQCQEECAISYLHSWILYGYACGACPHS